MKVEIARIPSSSIAPNEASMVDIPNNPDGLTAIIVRSSKKLTAWKTHKMILELIKAIKKAPELISEGIL